jgi:predicted GIY-YIG superfamily endonuclease
VSGDEARPAYLWWAVLGVAVCGVVATAHGLYEVALGCTVPAGISALYVPITDGLALVAYAATDRLRGAARVYAWAVVLVAAGLSGTAQAVMLGGLGEPPVQLRYGVGAWPAVAVAVAAHLLWLVGRPVVAVAAPVATEEEEEEEEADEVAWPEIPPRPEGAAVAVYRLYSARGNLIYVGCTSQPYERFQAHRRGAYWWHEVGDSAIHWFATADEGADEELWAIEHERPLVNEGRLIRYNPPPPVGQEPRPSVATEEVSAASEDDHGLHLVSVASQPPARRGKGPCGCSRCNGRQVSYDTWHRHNSPTGRASGA